MARAGPGAPGRGDPRGRIPYYRFLLPAGLLLTGLLGAYVYVLLLDQLFPNARARSLRRPRADGAAPVIARRGPARSARVLQTRENVACAGERRFDLWAQAQRWRELAEAQGMRASLRDEGGIPRSRGEVDLLIVPWVLCLAPEHAAW
jgi:hypothetical protein